jgi:hypothetical protein
MYPGSNRDVDTFRGRLLGVEDELIDALVQGSYTKPAIIEPAYEQPASSRTFSQPDLWEGRLLGVEEELVNALISPPEPQDSRMSQALVPPGYHSCPESRPESHRRDSTMWSTTAFDSIWRSVEVEDNNIRHNNREEERLFHHKASVSTTSTDIEHFETTYSTPTTPSLHASSPLEADLESPGASVTSIDSEDLILDSIILEQPGNVSFLGTWDLNDWQANVGGLLAVGKERDDRHGPIFSY